MYQPASAHGRMHAFAHHRRKQPMGPYATGPASGLDNSCDRELSARSAIVRFVMRFQPQALGSLSAP